MKAMVCEMCSSNDLVKQDGMYICQHCGTKYSVEEAKKLFVEGQVDVSGSTVKVDSSDELENFYTIARRAKDTENTKQAAQYYDLILQKDPNSWEATFYSFYYSTLEGRKGEVGNALVAFNKLIPQTFDIIMSNNYSDEELFSIISELAKRTQKLCEAMYLGGRDIIWAQYKDQVAGYGPNHNQFAYSVVVPATTLADLIEKNINTSDERYITIVNTLKDGNKVLGAHGRNPVNPYGPSYPGSTPSNPEGAKTGCYVATAVYGSYDCPEVWTLRRFRDYQLAKTWYGRAFIRTYYAISPTFVKWFGGKVWFKNLWKPKLDRMVNRLNSEGVSGTPYQDKRW